MNKSKIFPDIIEQAIYGLDNKIRLKILSILVQDVRFSFSQISENLPEISLSTLNYHLNELLSTALIKKIDYDSIDSPDHSYYSISTFGFKIIENLLSILYPNQYQS